MWFFTRRPRPAPRRSHNERDFDCKFWTGDRSGSIVGVINERCDICNPRETR